ncbi:MAG: general stress protein [Chloroflexi bacterium]|nr:general stress protein [Chloroflexota bacterium]
MKPTLPVIIAEFCQNHKGDLTLLKEMVWAAAEAGATYAKVQSMLADDLTFRERFEEGQWQGDQQVTIKRPYKAEYDRLKPMDLTDDAHRLFSDECHKAGIKPMTTIFSRSRIPFVASLGWDAIKVASYDCASLPMLRELMERFKYLFISVGATYDHEIETAAGLLNGHDYSFLHAVTIYPTPLNEFHLARMDYLRQFTSSVGMSDHSLVARDGIKASMAAISLGADVIERHFTVLPVDATKDGPVSVQPGQLKQLVDFSRLSRAEQQEIIRREAPEFEQMIGQRTRLLSQAEKLNRDYYRGRFASHIGGEIVYNWEEKPVIRDIL